MSDGGNRPSWSVRLRALARRALESTAAGRAALHRSRLYRVQWQARRKPARLPWRIVAPCVDFKFDAGAVQIGARLYVIGGYRAPDAVSPWVDVLDLARRRWVERIPLAAEVGHSHLAFATDGARYVYVVSGQHGPHCRPAIRHSAVLDVTTKAWRALPPLPEPRYAASMRLWRGRLHVLGGSRADRYTAAREHWSLAVAGDTAVDGVWREEVPIPHGVCHHASAILGEHLYLLGGQAGDFVARPGSAEYECSERTLETYSPKVFRLAAGGRTWERLADMPVPVSHTEAAVLVLGPIIVLVGGQCGKDPTTFKLELTDVVQALDTRTGAWRVIGQLPYREKTAVAGFHGGSLYIVGGQRDGGPAYPGPDVIVRDAWRARLPIET